MRHRIDSSPFCPYCPGDMVRIATVNTLDHGTVCEDCSRWLAAIAQPKWSEKMKWFDANKEAVYYEPDE